jgi:hypothetical protein
MQDLIVQGNESTPSIHAQWQQGCLAMWGDSYPENPFELYRPVIKWVESFLSSTDRPLTLRIELLYVNTSTIRSLMEIFDLLEAAHGEGRAVGLQWWYEAENERVAELAEEFREDYLFPFDIIAKPEPAV